MKLTFDIEDALSQCKTLAVNPWKNHWTHLATFFKYPEHIRKIIYATNTLE